MALVKFRYIKSCTLSKNRGMSMEQVFSVGECAILEREGIPFISDRTS